MQNSRRIQVGERVYFPIHNNDSSLNFCSLCAAVYPRSAVCEIDYGNKTISMFPIAVLHRAKSHPETFNEQTTAVLRSPSGEKRAPLDKGLRARLASIANSLEV